jgi:NitT/TauT family transport system substrate-binding protein
MTHKHLQAIAVALSGCLAFGSALAQAPKPEKPKVVMAMAGVSSQIYFLVPNLAARLGFFKDEGLEVETIDTGSGAKGLAALVGGNADVTAGAYEHTIHMQPKGVNLKCIALFGSSGGTVLGVVKSKAKPNASVSDLKGQVIGVSAPGSSTHVFLNLALAKVGLNADDVSVLAVGNASGAVAAVRSGRLGGISGVDPVMTELELAGDIAILADARTEQGGKAAYGGPYASGCLYATAEFIEKNPNTVQALANAIVRTLKWVKSTPPDKLVATLPAEYSQGNPAVYRAALERNLPGIPSDGVVGEEAAKTVLRVVQRADPKLDASKIDLSKTYDNRFVRNALKKYP